MIPFGVSFDGFIPISEAVAFGQAAEAAGARSFWIAEHLGHREPFLTAMALLNATEHARVFPTAISPYLRHPTPTAMALASLAELHPNRVGVAVGVGNPMFLKESGVAIDKPVGAVRDYVAALRALFSGEPVEIDGRGESFRLDGARMGFAVGTPPAVYTAPTGPQMLKLSGKIADGLVLSAGLTTAFARRSLAIAEEGARDAGRDPASLRKTSYIYFIAGGDRAERDRKVLQKLAFLFRNKGLAENLAGSGVALDHEALMAAVARRDMDEAVSLVPAEAIDAFTVAGDAAECRKRLQAYLDIGLEEPVLALIGDAQDRLRSLDVIKTV